ncbi:DUF6531 domain-containing protein [Vibrio coralliilyticus]|uniref:DUF6531 domain-containing protein n=1 Tax=Vibrio coralliilyticus TaxID=190893 RepID=UPI0006CC5229|nr:DUF6531 domain-containing protein [Vibrio coralliilyticus]AXN30735.1 LysM peptidoglycan-binding domain-containing protein [Vibrio coralliilyticus]KPH27118.1 hypothetical protein ADU60_02320 [Vibrio coralliilyticus]
MATVIGGSGLGLFDTLGQSGIKLGGNNGLQINASSGNLVLHHQDQTLVSKGLDLSLARTYNSQGNRQDANGDNWRFSFEREIQVAGDVVKRITGDGHQAVFNVKGSRYESTAGAGAHDSLSRQGEEWVYQEGTTGVKEYYNAQDGRLLRAEDRFGNQTHYQYQDGRLTAIKSASGEQLRFVFNDDGQLSRVDSWTQDSTGNLTHSHSQVHYDYDVKGRLSSVSVDLSPQDKSIVDGQVMTTTYSYRDEHSYLLKQISKSNGSVITLDYQDVASKPHLSRIDDNGIVTLLDYQPSRANGHQLKVTDAKGQQWYYQHDEQGRLVGSLPPIVSYNKDTGHQANPTAFSTGPINKPHATRYHYDEENNLVAVVETGARGERVTSYRYDVMGNRISKEETGQWRERYDYDELNRLVATHINNTPAEEGHRYAIYDGLQLRFEITEAGLVTEHEYDGFGQRIRSRVYAKASLMESIRPDIQAVTRWSELQDKSQTQLTEFTYQRGLLHTQTHYEQVTADGEGIIKPALDVVAASEEQATAGVWVNGLPVGGQERGVTLTRFNAKGQMVSSHTFDTHQNNEQADQFLTQLFASRRELASGDRLYLSTNGQWHSDRIHEHLGIILRGEFKLALTSFGSPHEKPWSLPSNLLIAFEKPSDDEHVVLIEEQSASEGHISYSDGTQHTRLTYDAFGQLLSSDTLVGSLQTGELKQVSSATQIYDGLGRVISETNAQGVTTTTQYLDASRQVLVTQAGGATVTRTYSTAGQLVSETHQAPEQPARQRQFVYNEAGQLVATQHPDGGERFQFYDAKGRLWLTVSETGAVTEYRRDPQGRVVLEAQYASKMDTLGWLVDSKLTVTGESILSSVPIDVKPRVKMSWFQEDRESQRTTVTLTDDAKYLTNDSWLDSQNRSLHEVRYGGNEYLVISQQYDSSGRMVLSRDQEGYVTEYKYNSRGQVTETRHYHQAAEVEPDGITIPASDYDRTQTLYDSRGRVRFHLDEKGALKETRYLDGGRDKKVYFYDLGRENLSQLDISDILEAIQSGRVQSEFTLGLYSRERRDGAGRLISSIDQYGAETRYVYDGKTGLLRQTITAANTSESRSEYRQYNGFGELTGKVTQTGQQDWQSLKLSSLINNKGSRSVFDVMGRQTSEHHPATGTTTYQYDKAGRLTQTTDAKGHTRSQQYNTYGEVSRTFTDGVMTREFEYDLMGRLNREVDGEGVQTTYLYNPEGQLSHKVLERVEKERINQGSSFLSAVTARHVTQFQYDKRGNVIHQQVLKDERNGEILSVSETGKMVRSGNLKYTSQWQRKYDHRGRVVSETNGEGVERVTEYVASGRYKAVKLSDAVQELIELDALGRTVSVRNGADERTTYEYDDARQRVTVISPGGVRTVTEKNAHGETVSITDGQGHQRRFEYNAHGQVTRTTFLAHGEDQPQTLSTNEYDAQTGLLTFSTNAEGIRTEYRYDALGRQWKVIQDADGEKLQTTYAYNADGQRISENHEGRVTTLRYDTQGRRIWVEQGGVVKTFAHDLTGQVIREAEGATDLNGQGREERVTEFDRDAMGLVLEKRVRSGKDWSGRNSLRSVSYRYNAAGQVIEKQTGQGGIARTVYDELGRVQFEINALNYVTAYEYDVANRITKTTRYAKALPILTVWTADKVTHALSGSARTTEHRYDEAGRLAFDIDGLGYATGYEYDAANRVIRTTRYAKPVTDTSWLTASVDNRVSESIYDAHGRLRFTISEKGQVSERAYDVMGRITHMIRYDQSVILEDRSEASLSAFKSQLAQEVAAGRVRSELSVFDALGRLRFELDGEGYLVEYQYTRHSEQARKKVYVENDSLKREFALLKANNADYQAEKTFLNGYVQTQDEEDAQTTSYFYDERGNKIAERSAKVDYLDLDASGHESLQTEQQLVTEFQYDSLGNVTSIKRASGTSMESEEKFVFDVQGNQGQSIGVGGSRVYFDDQGLAIVHVNLQGGRRDKVYDSLGQLRFDVDELGFITEHKYNAFGEKYLQVRYESAIPNRTIGQPVLLEEIESFVTQANVKAKNRTIAYEFDDGGRQKSVKTYGSATPDQRIDIVQYNAFGDKVQSNMSDGVDTYVSNQQLFSRNGALFASKNAENYITYYEYNGHGEIKSKVEYADKYLGDWTEAALTTWMASQTSNERIVEYVYDKNGNKRKTILKNALFHTFGSNEVDENRADVVSSSFFDHAGRVVLSAVSSGSQSDDDIRAYKSSLKYQYDALGRLISTWSAEKAVVDFRPETLGNVPQSFERLQTRFFYDARGNQVKVIAGDRINYTYYNAEGLRTGSKDAEGHFSRVNMDNMNRVISEGQHVSSTVSAQGLSYSHDMVNEYRYDATGRQVATRQKVSSGDIDQSVEYNAYGEIISRKLNGSVTESYQYDSLGNVIKEIKNGIQKTYQYGISGKVTSESTYYYDNESESLLPSTTNRYYDLLGNLVREEKPDVSLYDNVYEDLQRGQKPTYSLVKPVTEQQLDRWGNVVKKTVNGVQYEFEYNHKNQLVKQVGPRVTVIEDNGSISFRRPVTLFYYNLRGNRIAVQDANGNWQKTAYDNSGTKAFDINSEGHKTYYVHNIHGDMIGRIPPGELGEMYHYDKKSQLLARAKITLGGRNVVVYERYTYDQVGRRTSETRYGDAGYQSFVKYDEVSNVLETHGKGVHRKYEYNDRGEKVSEAWLRNGVEKSKKQYRYSQQTGKKIEDILADGSKVAYRYDHAGFLTAKNGAGIDVKYKYYNDGKLRMRHSADKIETYSYDLNGREVWRQLKTNGDLQRYNGSTITRTDWDRLGRIQSLKTYEAKLAGRSLNGAEIKYEYDAVGNRRKVTSRRVGVTSYQWYHYDSENREIASHKQQDDMTIGRIKWLGAAGSRVTEYDRVGRKIVETEWGDTKKERKIGYDAESGHLSGITEYTTYGDEEVVTREFSQSNTITGHTTYSSDVKIEFAYRSGKATETKRNESLKTSTYENGLLKQQIVWKDIVGGVKDHETTFNYHYTGQIASQRTFILRLGDSMQDTVEYKYFKRDPFKRSRITHSRVMVDRFNPFKPDSNRWVTGETKFKYDSAGNLLFVESTKQESERFVLSDFDSQIKLQIKNRSTLTANLAVAGNQVGILSAYELDSDLLDDSVSNTASQPGSYTVKSGDSLQKISHALFGDSRYWYLIADANGLSPNEKPLTGQVLLIPNIHTQTFNGAESFKPYNESEVLGDVNPEPMPPPPPKKSCNPVAQIIMVVVAVVVTIYTAGAAAGAIGAMLSATGTGVAGAATIGAAGIGVLSGAAVATSTVAGIAAAAVGGAIGAAASQLVGKALGVVDDFSWEQVALGGLTAAATAGVGAALRTGVATFGNQFSENIARSAVNYSTNYMGSKALGMDVSFSWEGFTASVVGGLVSSSTNKYLNSGVDPISRIVGGTASGFAGAAVSSLLRGESLRSRSGQLLTDAFGNSLANVSRGDILTENEIAKLKLSMDTQRRIQLRPAIPKQVSNEPTTIVTPLSKDDAPDSRVWFEEDVLEMQRSHPLEAQQSAREIHGDITERAPKLYSLEKLSGREGSVFTPPSTQISIAGLALSFLDYASKKNLGIDLEVPIYAGPSATTMKSGNKIFGPALEMLGDKLSKFSFAASLYSAGASYANSDYQFETREWVSEGGKVIVDGVSLSTGVKAFSSMARYSPVGALYTAADLTVQTHPDYTIRHGANAGEVIRNSGWTAIYYSLMDVQQELPPQPKPSQWHLQGHLSNYDFKN